MSPTLIQPWWPKRIMENLSGLGVESVRVDILPHQCQDIQILARVKESDGRIWDARMVLDEMDPMLGDVDKISAKMRDIITDPKYRK